MSTSNTPIPWWLPQTGTPEEREYINQVLDANYINEGNLSAEFEQRIASMVNASHGVSFTNCTSGIFAALKTLGIGHGDEVIVPDMTFIATANAVHLTGATPVLIDVDENLVLNLESLERVISPKTKAIVPVHVTGRGPDMTKLMNIARAHNLFVVEDAAEALGSMQNGKYLGTFGDAGCFSFSPNKTITCGQGGVVVTNNPEIEVGLHMMKDQGRPVRGSGGDDIHHTRGFNFKFTNLQAAVGLGQLEYFSKRIERMKRNYMLYQKHLSDVVGLELYPSDIEHGAIPQWTDIKTERRDELVAELKKNNMDARNYWHPIHTQKPYFLSDEHFPNSTRLSPQSVWLPSAFTLTDEDIHRVCEVIKNFFS